MKGKKILPVFFPGFACPRQCIFCNQSSITGKTHIPSPLDVFSFLDASLPANLHDFKYEIGFYGGSFTCAPPELQRAYLKAAAYFIDMGRANTVRLSTRPDALSNEVLDLLADYPVSTVEVAAQSMDDEVLKKAGRGYISDVVIAAADLIKKYEMNYAIQLMVGLPGETREIAIRSAEKAALTEPAAVRIYPTIVLENTQLAKMFRNNTYLPLSVEEAVERSKQMICILMKADADIIRIGLQGSDSLRAAGTMVAGPWHDSFGELVYSALYYDILMAMCDYIKAKNIMGKALHIQVPLGSASQVAGNLKHNKIMIYEKYALELKIEEITDLKKFELRLFMCGNNSFDIKFDISNSEKV